MDNKRKNYLNNKGQAMIAVLCIMAVILAICFSLLLSSYQMFASVNDQSRGEQWYQQAYTFSNIISLRLTDANSTDTSFKTEYADTFMKDATKKNNTSISIKANPSANDYSEMNITLKKLLIGASESTTYSAENYYLLITVDSIVDNKTKASVITKYKVNYGEDKTSLVYTYMESVQ
jgi:hypothetical protein